MLGRPARTMLSPTEDLETLDTLVQIHHLIGSEGPEPRKTLFCAQCVGCYMGTRQKPSGGTRKRVLDVRLDLKTRLNLPTLSRLTATRIHRYPIVQWLL